MFSSNATQVSAVTQAEAVDFDGTNDYLSRASNLTGNTDGKTLTFSGWIWANSATAQTFYAAGTGSELIIFCDVSGGALNFRVLTSDTTLTTNLSVTSSAGLIPLQTWTHILLSVDLNNSANRSIYVNDVLISPTWTIYTNSTIDRTFTTYNVANNPSSSTRAKGRLSNVYLDYTYRDLSITANRRLFVTADLKPAAGQAALNPILYLPMSDPTTVGTNAGTGGNFTLNGVVARSGRGPNQYNAPYSDLDGTADYLSRTTAPTGIADSKTFTIQFVLNTDVLSAYSQVIGFYEGGSAKVSFQLDTTGIFYLVARNAAGTVIFNAVSAAVITPNRNYVFTLSVDLSNTANRHFYLNGQAVALTWTTYTNDFIDFAISASPSYRIGASNAPANYVNGRLGALWFNTSYIDLSVASNLAKFVTGTGIDAKPVDLGASGELPTGTSPLIYLPMYGGDAGKNYGTGGDFTVNSGPYTGARGPNEFWGNKAKFVNSYVGRSSSFNWGSTNKFTCSFWINNITNASGQQNIFYLGDSGSAYFSARLDASNRVEFWAADSSGTMILSVRSNTAIATGSSAYVQACFDLSDAAKRFIYINGANSLTSTTYTNTSTPSFNFARIGDNAFANYQLSEVYLLPDYIDFSVEANRLKFYDAFGNPTDLPSAIAALSVTNPPIYMRFPPTAFGTNSGTGGAFTVTGTITDGGQL